MRISDTIKSAGVVGAGGAGFPAHVKAASQVDTIIANGAECEPLIHKDLELMIRYADRVVHGVALQMKSTGAQQGIISVKGKNKTAIQAFEKAIQGTPLTIHQLGDFYPSGDEYILVYEATGRLIPPQGIPLNIGIVVNNVETLFNISLAAEGKPVTEKFLTVAGAVKHPCSFLAPIGMSYRDAIEYAGGQSVQDVAVFVGGIMMGKLEFNFDLPITKTTAGLVVLPVDHTLVQRKSQTEKSMHRIGKSACDQCSYCTELCPRYVLGYDVQPHKVMRSLGFTATGEAIWNQYAELCCACGLCTLYACPESLFPKEACDKSKRDMREQGIKWSGKKEVEPHPMYEGRRTPLKMLVKRLGITEYDHESEFRTDELHPTKVEIPLTQHIGKPAMATVEAGDRVIKGQCIGEIPDGQLGAKVHASIDGVVRSIGDSVVIHRE
jgi:Na+-translocating ferredoxin:NAD+ oxidoreductase RnfC subunit